MGESAASYRRVVDALIAGGHKHKVSHHHIQASCPLQPDRKPSLSIDYRPGDGKTHLHCHSCKAEEAELAEALGLPQSALFDDWVDEDEWQRRKERGQRRRPSRKPRTEGKRSRLGPLPKRLTEPPEPVEVSRREVEAEDYVDPATGEVVAQNVRVELELQFPDEERRRLDKTFFQRFADNAGGWLDTKPAGLVVPLWRLRDIREAIERGWPVWVSEGEKDAKALLDAGVFTTTNIGGATNFTVDHAEQLRGGEVTLVLDRDLAGYTRGLHIVGLLTNMASSVRIVLPAVDGQKADAFDHLQAGHTVDDFVEVGVDQLRALKLAAEVDKLVDKGVFSYVLAEVDARLEHATAAEQRGAGRKAEDEQRYAARWALEAGRRFAKLIQTRQDLERIPDLDRDLGQRVDDQLGKARTVTRDAFARSGADIPAELAAVLDGPEQQASDQAGVVIEHPTSARLPAPAHPIPTATRSQLRYEPGGEGRRTRGVYVYDAAENWWRMVAPLPYVRARIVRRTGAGDRCGTDYLLAATEDSKAVIVSHLQLRDGSWANELGLSLSDETKIVNAASTAIRYHAEEVPEREAVPQVDQSSGRFTTVDSDTLPTGYLACAEVDRTEALRVWARILTSAAQSPRLAHLLGASAVAPFIGPLGRQSHFVALYGDSDQGKTIGLKLAGGLWGNSLIHGGVVQSWNTSPTGLSRFLGTLGYLPAFLDEAGMAKWGTSPTEWGQVIYDLCEGSQRLTAEIRGAGIRLSAPWDGIVFSAGNGRLTDGLGAGKFAGVGKRVIDLETPITNCADQAEELDELLPDAIGHAGDEILTRYTVPQVRQLVEAAAERIGLPEGGNQRTIAKSLHAHAAGAAMLDQICETGTVLYDAVCAAAADYLAEWAPPEHDADRVLKLIRDLLGSQPAAWPTLSDYRENALPHRWSEDPEDEPTHRMPQHGVDRRMLGARADDGTWIAIFTTPWHDMCEQAGIDESVALRELHKRGLLLVTEGRRRRREWTTPIRLLRGEHQPFPMYKLQLPADDEAPEAAAEPPDQAPVGGGTPDCWGSVGGPVGGPNTPLTSNVGGVGGVGGSNITHARARGPNASDSDRGDEPGAAMPTIGSTTVISPDPDNETRTVANQAEPCEVCGGLTPYRVNGHVAHLMCARTGQASSVTAAAPGNDRDIDPPVKLATPQPCGACGQPASHAVRGTPVHLGECADRLAVNKPQQPAQAVQPALDETTAEEPANQPEARTTGPAVTAGLAEGKNWPAAVAHTDGVWLPDGSRLPLPEPLIHLGQLAQIAEELQLGAIGERQIWLTHQLVEQLGLLVTDLPIRRADAEKMLAEASAGLAWFEAAREAGWEIGSPGRIAGSIRVWPRGGGKGCRIVLIPYLHKLCEMANDDPEPARLAQRLHRFAELAGLPFRTSAAATGTDLLENILKDRRRRIPGPKQPVEAPPPMQLRTVEADPKWSRALLPTERERKFLHLLDRSAQHLAASSSVVLGNDQPATHLVAENQPIGFNPRWAGDWLIERIDLSDWRIPDPLLSPDRDDTSDWAWAATPTLALLTRDLGLEVNIREAWVWSTPCEWCAQDAKRRKRDVTCPGGHRYTEAWYKRLEKSRAAAAGTADDTVIKTLKGCWASMHGYLAKRDREHHPLYRPDWAHQIRAAAKANLIRMILKAGEHTNVWPVFADVDAVGYLSDDPDPKDAWPGDPAKLGKSLGQIWPYRSAELTDELVELLSDPGVPPSRLVDQVRKHTTPYDEWLQLIHGDAHG